MALFSTTAERFSSHLPMVYITIQQAQADEHILTFLASFYLVLVNEILVRDF